MGLSTTIDVIHKNIDGWHVFEAEQLPGLYVANRDPLRAFNAVGPAIEKLVMLDSGVECRAMPAVPFAEFLHHAQAGALQGDDHLSRFSIFREAA